MWCELPVHFQNFYLCVRCLMDKLEIEFGWVHSADQSCAVLLLISATIIWRVCVRCIIRKEYLTALFNLASKRLHSWLLLLFWIENHHQWTLNVYRFNKGTHCYRLLCSLAILYVISNNYAKSVWLNHINDDIHFEIIMYNVHLRRCVCFCLLLVSRIISNNNNILCSFPSLTLSIQI